MLKRSDLITQLKASVKTDSTRWESGAFDTAIDDALRKISDVRPLTAIENISLIAGTAFYPVNEHAFKYIGSEWGLDNTIKPWDIRFPGRLPQIFLVDKENENARYIQFLPAPNQQHLNAFGSVFPCQCGVLHLLTEDDCSVKKEDQDLLFLAALIALMQQLVAANVSKPITLSRGMTSIANNATPLAAFNALQTLFDKKAQPDYV